jgi:hypothetical protein
MSPTNRARLVGAVVAGLLCVAVAVGFTYRHANGRKVVLTDATFASIPSLHWTCEVTVIARHQALICTSDDKPIRSVRVLPHQITVGGVADHRPSTATIGSATSPTSGRNHLRLGQCSGMSPEAVS